MTSTIPVSQLASSTPSVLSAGGTALALNGLVLTNSTRVPIGTVQSFPTAASVGAYFGLSSPEYTGSLTYFAGYTISTIKPSALLFAQYNTANVAAWLRGGSMSSVTIAQLQAMSGTLTITTNGTALTSSTISLAAATSFSNAATIIQAGFTSPPFAVTFDSISGAFLFTSTATGATATITYATGTLAANLNLTSATGAVTSQGAAAAVPGTLMAQITNITTNWAQFTTSFDPDAGSGNALKLAFATWVETTGSRYAYVAWDTDVTPTQSTAATTSLGYIIKSTSLSGTVCVYAPNNGALIAYFVLGFGASINFNASNGRATLAGKSGSGLVADVTDATTASNLKANGYRFYGSYGENANNFVVFEDGGISGQYEWLDSYLNQIYLNSQFRLAMMTLLTSMQSIPYNAAGTAIIEQGLSTPIAQFKTFGGLQAGTTLSGTQIAAINAGAGGIDAATSVANDGYYLQVLVGSAQVRAARSSPPINFWYADGGSVQTMNIASIEVQ